MCSNYRPVTDQDALLKHFGVSLPDGKLPLDTFPAYLAPFIRRKPDQYAHEREAQVGRFGLVPRWARELAMGRKTYNARSETVREKPSFRDAWAKGRRCLVPVHWIIEPNYESGAHVPWRIGMADWSPYAIAGLWDSWLDKDTGREELSFTMLTVNADDHALMKRFHKPQDEKRMVVILPRHDEDRWLDCSVQEAWSMVRQFPADRMAAAPRDEPLERQLF